ncbi:MAG: hypothetical protein CMA08_03240 [Euryarchaeota archaeon]|nr:hypothetical protein [Euryarchaeota archaeon]OUX22242.1 MAG: hypothetical protein CBE12_02595 [Euryarchaeota archaeon TMED252]
MAEASAPPWAGDAGQHKERAAAPAPVMLTDAAVTSTLSGQPVLTGAVAGTSAYAGPVGGKSAWQKGTYWRFVGMACGLQLILAAVLLSTTLAYLGVDDVYVYETVEVEVTDGKGEVRLNPDGDLRLSDISKSYNSADYGTDAWYQNELWLDYGVSVSYGYGYYGDDRQWDEETPRSVMMTYAPVDFDDITFEVSNDWDNRSLSISTDLWLNHSNTTTTFYNSNYWNGQHEATPNSTEEGWEVNYTPAGFQQPCDFQYAEFLIPHPALEEDERIRLTVYLLNCWGSDPSLMDVYFETEANMYGIEVGGWAPNNSTLWFDHKQVGNTTLMLDMEFENIRAWEQEDRRGGAQGTMLALAPLLSLLGLPILAIVGGLTKGRSAGWGAMTGFLLMPGSFIFWLWASFATW